MAQSKPRTQRQSQAQPSGLTPSSQSPKRGAEGPGEGPSQRPSKRPKKQPQPNPADDDNGDINIEANSWKQLSTGERSNRLYANKFLEDRILQNTTDSLNSIRSIWSIKDKSVEFLASCRSFMFEKEEGMMLGEDIQKLFEKDFDTPNDTVFEGDIFRDFCNRAATRDKAVIMQMIHRLIVPSAEIAALRKAGFQHLSDSISERWDSARNLDAPNLPKLQVPGYWLPMPRPDYAVGFKQEAFTDGQLEKLQGHISVTGIRETTFFKGTKNMFFPFLTAEAMPSTESLDLADRTNAHTCTISVRGVVELFKVVKREKELDRKLLAFSISHDHRSVRIYGHYPVIHGEKVEYYRHTIKEFSFTATDGKDRWTTYNFVMAIYKNWAPSHLQFLRSAIDDLEKPNFDSPTQSPRPFGTQETPPASPPEPPFEQSSDAFNTVPGSQLSEGVRYASTEVPDSQQGQVEELLRGSPNMPSSPKSPDELPDAQPREGPPVPLPGMSFSELSVVPEMQQPAESETSDLSDSSGLSDSSDENDADDTEYAEPGSEDESSDEDLSDQDLSDAAPEASKGTGSKRKDTMGKDTNPKGSQRKGLKTKIGMTNTESADVAMTDAATGKGGGRQTAKKRGTGAGAGTGRGRGRGRRSGRG